jgi:hypothetical protein
MICGRLLAPVHHDASPPYDSQIDHQVDRQGCDEHEDKLDVSCPMPEKAVMSSACLKMTIPPSSPICLFISISSYFYSFARSVAHRT